MVATKSSRTKKEQLLGEIETRITGMQYYDSEIPPGEQVNLEREPENSHDENSIRVENVRFEPVGHLPRRLCSWLAPMGLRANAVCSETDSLTDGFAAVEDRLKEYRDQLQLPEDAAGIVVAQGEKVIGVDLFDCPQTLGTLWERLSNAYFFDALRNKRRRRKTTKRVAREFVQQVPDYCRLRTPTLGMGNELEIAGDGVVGAALLFSGQVCHLSAFSEEQ